ncbi:MAG: SMP-30/gluconolactonase/LRE family protein [Pelolinea sp.]|nr:SMP-30/gluconolactonase/LRE family protein [Pelolinea sp.]
MKMESYRSEFRELIDPQTPIEKVADGFTFTEGPIWDTENNRLLFSDIPENKIFSWSEKQGTSIYRSPSKFSNGLTFDPHGNLIICEHQGRAISSLDKNKAYKTLANSYEGMKLNSPNDVISAKDGSILFTDPIYGLRSGIGGPGEQELAFQGVFRLPPDSSQLELITDSFERPNGLLFSPDEKQLFICDTVRQHIRMFDVKENWTFSGGQVWAELWDESLGGRPDGMKIDILGNMFCTGPGGIWVFDINANLLGRIFLPEKTSNLAWGDPDRRSLFITSNSMIYRIRCNTNG